MCCSPLACALTAMAVCKQSDVWTYFTSTNSQDVVCDTCGKKVRCCGNTIYLVKHLRVNHITEYDERMLRQTEDEERDRCCQGKESFSAASRQHAQMARNFSFLYDNSALLSDKTK